MWKQALILCLRLLLPLVNAQGLKNLHCDTLEYITPSSGAVPDNKNNADLTVTLQGDTAKDDIVDAVNNAVTSTSSPCFAVPAVITSKCGSYSGYDNCANIDYCKYCAHDWCPRRASTFCVRADIALGITTLQGAHQNVFNMTVQFTWKPAVVPSTSKIIHFKARISDDGIKYKDIVTSNELDLMAFGTNTKFTVATASAAAPASAATPTGNTTLKQPAVVPTTEATTKHTGKPGKAATVSGPTKALLIFLGGFAAAAIHLLALQ